MTNLGPSEGSKDPPGPLLGCAYGYIAILKKHCIMKLIFRQSNQFEYGPSLLQIKSNLLINSFLMLLIIMIILFVQDDSKIIGPQMPHESERKGEPGNEFYKDRITEAYSNYYNQ